METLARRKSSPRLRGFSYAGTHAYMVTINTFAGAAYFQDVEVATSCCDQLLAQAATHEHDILAYCLTPNHLHLLVQGRSEDAELGKFIRTFKQITGFHFKQRTGRLLWQRSYYDHIVRSEEDLRKLSEYIWNNPVRAGLVEDRNDYPFSGPIGQT